MAITTGKRKREHAPVAKPNLSAKKNGAVPKSAAVSKKSKIHSESKSTTRQRTSGPIHVQIVTGSYERILHGIAVTIPAAKFSNANSTENAQSDAKSNQSKAADVTFSHNFLFAAHLQAIRCLAISPPTEEADKRILATGSSDERINIYSLSTAPPPANAQTVPQLPVLSSATSATAENPRNRSLGNLTHHDRAITCLAFPTKTKLFSGAEDATIAISRTRDWTMLSSIKAPIPKPQGRPSGDTAGPGEIPAGVNAFAIHPSQKLMLSVGRSEKCMRLWNLMTGKKAGVLNFGRELLMQVGEGKYSSGEGRRVLWDGEGENYVVGFEKGAALFGIDSKPRAVIRPSPSSKIHQMRFVPQLEDSTNSILAVSTEDGRTLFYDITTAPLADDDQSDELPLVSCVAALGGSGAEVVGRVKDFEIIAFDAASPLLVITASSDGAVRLWTLGRDELASNDQHTGTLRQVGHLLATQETGNRITCIGAFPLDGKVLDDVDDDFEGFDDGAHDGSGSSGEDDA